MNQTQHYFSIEIAQEMGIIPAIILQNLSYWIDKNKANNRHYYDGYYWTYNTINAFKDLFPYMTEYSIVNGLNKLEENGYIITGNYNKLGYDRTKWYAIVEINKCITRNQQMDTSKSTNGFVEINGPIPDINTNINTDNNNPIVPLTNDTNFEDFWKLYPKKINKKKSKSLYTKINAETHHKIIKDLEQRVNSKEWRNDNGKFIPHATTYLNGERWNDEISRSNAVPKLNIKEY